jgi:hypothetical protein
MRRYSVRHWVGLLVLSAACSPGQSGGAVGSFRTTIDTIGDTIVAHTTGTVRESDARHFEVVWRAGSGDAESTSFASIVSVAVGRDDRVYTWDSRTPALRMYDANGVQMRVIGRRGNGPGEWDRINGIAVHPDGRLFVWDGGNARMNVYTVDGAFETSWLLPVRGFFTSNGILCDNGGRIWVRANFRVGDDFANAKPGWIRFTPTGVVIDTVRAPEPGGDPWLVAREGGSSSSTGIPFGRYPTTAITPAGDVVWGLTGPYELHADVAGRPLRITRDVVPLAIGAEERVERRASTEFNLRRTQPSWTWDGPDVPSVRPAFTGIATAPDGRLWVSLSVESERYEPDPPSTLQTPAPPAVHYRSKERRWDVFGEDGRYLGQVVASRLVSPMVMRGDFAWGQEYDSDDVPTLVKWRLVPPLR